MALGIRHTAPLATRSRFVWGCFLITNVQLPQCGSIFSFDICGLKGLWSRTVVFHQDWCVFMCFQSPGWSPSHPTSSEWKPPMTSGTVSTARRAKPSPLCRTVRATSGAVNIWRVDSLRAVEDLVWNVLIFEAATLCGRPLSVGGVKKVKESTMYVLRDESV